MFLVKYGLWRCILQVTINMLDEKFRRRHSEIFSFFPENRLWHYMQIVFLGDSSHEMSKPHVSGKNETDIINLSSAEFVQRLVKDKHFGYSHYDGNTYAIPREKGLKHMQT